MSRMLSFVEAGELTPQTVEDLTLSGFYNSWLRLQDPNTAILIRFSPETYYNKMVREKRGVERDALSKEYFPAVYYPNENGLSLIEVSTSSIQELLTPSISPSGYRRRSILTRLNLDDETTIIPIAWFHGMVVHELGHARHTCWDSFGEPLTQNERTTFTLLEEIRMESRVVSDDGANAKWLKACSIKLIYNDVLETLGKYQQLGQMVEEGTLSVEEFKEQAPQPLDLPSLIALIFGRISAGVYTRFLVEKLWTIVSNATPAETFDGAIDILDRLALIEDDDFDGFFALVKEWLELFKPEEGGEDGEEDGLPSPFSMPGMSKEDAQELAEAISEALSDASRAANAEVPKDIEGIKPVSEIYKEITDFDRAPILDQGDATFGENPTPAKGRPGGIGNKHKNPIKAWRSPTGAEIASSVRLAKALADSLIVSQAAVWRKADMPGRFVANRAIERSAEIQMGRFSEIKPFDEQLHRLTRNPKLTVGAVFDVSGSMDWAAGPMGSVAWIMSQAFKRYNATFGMTTFGDFVTGIVRPGKHLDQVPILDCAEGTQVLTEGIMALDGKMKLSWPTNEAKLLFLITDGEMFGGFDKNYFEKYMRAMIKNGTLVYQLDLNKNCCPLPGCKVLETTQDTLVTDLIREVILTLNRKFREFNV